MVQNSVLILGILVPLESKGEMRVGMKESVLSLWEEDMSLTIIPPLPQRCSTPQSSTRRDTWFLTANYQG